MVVPSTSTPYHAFSTLNRGFSSYSHGSRPPDAHWHPTEVSRTLEIYNVLLRAHADDEEELEVIREVDPIWAVFGEHRSRSAVWDGQETMPDHLRGSRGPRMSTDLKDRARYEEAVDDCVVERLRTAIGRTRVALHSHRQRGARDIRSRDIYDARRHHSDEALTALDGANAPRRCYTPMGTNDPTARPFGLPTPSSRRNVSTTPRGVAMDRSRYTVNGSRNLDDEDTVRFHTPDGARSPHHAGNVLHTPMSQDDNIRHGGRAPKLQRQPRHSLSREEGVEENAPSIRRAQFGQGRQGPGGLSAIQETDDLPIVGSARWHESMEQSTVAIDSTIVPRTRDAHAPRVPAIAGNESVSRRKVRAKDDAPSTGVNRLRAPESAPSENPISLPRSEATLQREAREGGTLVPQVHGAYAPHMPATAGNENVSQDEVRGRYDAPTTGVHRLRAPESAPNNPNPSSKRPATAREGEAPKGTWTSNNVGEFTAIGVSAIARVSESVEDGVERIRGHEQDTQLGAAVDAHGRVSAGNRRAVARRNGDKTIANANTFNGTEGGADMSRANADDGSRARRDTGAVRYALPNEFNNLLAHDGHTVVRSENREFVNQTHLDTRARARVHLCDRVRSLPLRESASAEADRQDRRGRAVARPTSDHLDGIQMGRRDTARQFASRTEVESALARRERAIARPGNEEATTTYHGVRAIARAERPIPPSFSVYADAALLADDGGGGFDVVERRGRDFDRSARTGRWDRSNDRAGRLERRRSNERPMATRYVSPNEVDRALARGERTNARSEKGEVEMITTYRGSRAVARTEQPTPPPSKTRAMAALARDDGGRIDAVERRKRDFIGSARAGRRDRSIDRANRPEWRRSYERAGTMQYASSNEMDITSARGERAYARSVNRVSEGETHHDVDTIPRVSSYDPASSRAPPYTAWSRRVVGRRGYPDLRGREAGAQIAYRVDSDGLSPRQRHATARREREDDERERAIAIGGGPSSSASARRGFAHRARHSRDVGSDTGSHFDATRRNFVVASVSSWSSASSGTIVPASRASSRVRRAHAHDVSENHINAQASVYSVDSEVRRALTNRDLCDSDYDDDDDSETEHVEASSEGHDCACGGKCHCNEFLSQVDEVDRFDEPETEYGAQAYIQIPLSSDWYASIDVDHDGSVSYPDTVCFPVVYDQDSEYDDECFDECFEYNDETGSYDPDYECEPCEPCYQYDDGYYYECGPNGDLCYDVDPQDEGNCYYDDQTGIIECVENDDTQEDDSDSGQYDQYEEPSYGSEEDWDNS
ncbi:hypothetical protein PLICRDRAFT_700412 [Plicaturopsis crispa FD-325 SS-3]|nr:hypothetical protein PLICRDRAFT_700412 [Plicaturopsis crispa FD-325 SS-3]